MGFIYPNYKPVAIGQSFTIDNRLGPDGKPLDPATYGTAGTFFGQLKEHNISWSVGADYKPVPDVLLYANISEGYKAGSFPEVAAAAWSQLQAIKQEKLLDYEIGFKSQLLDRHITLNGGAFYYDYSNKQLRAKIVDGIFGPLDALVNVPKSSIKGGELELSARPITGLSIDVAATYLDASVSQYEGVVGASVDPTTGLRVPVLASYTGAALPFAPKWQGTVGTRYELPISNTINGFVGAEVAAQSTSYAVLAITPEDKGDYAVRTRTLTNADLGIKAPDGRWQAMLWGKNVFNRYYTINTIQDYDTRVRYAGRPAEYGVAVGYKFK